MNRALWQKFQAQKTPARKIALESIKRPTTLEPKNAKIDLWEWSEAPKKLRMRFEKKLTGQKHTHEIERAAQKATQTKFILSIKADQEVYLEWTNCFLDAWPLIGIHVEKGSNVTIIEKHQNHSALVGAENLFIITEEESRVDYFLESEKINSFQGLYRAEVGRMTTFNWHLYGHLENEHHLNVIIDHPHEGSQGNIYSALKASKKSDTFMELLNNHVGKHTGGDIRVRGLGDDQSRADISGLIEIGKEAQFTNSHLYEDMLTLTEKSKIRAEPNLEILNNEVVCTHAAAVGSVDEEALHYLNSRGLTAEQGRAMMTQGFLRVIIPEIKNKRIAKRFSELIN